MKWAVFTNPTHLSFPDSGGHRPSERGGIYVYQISRPAALQIPWMRDGKLQATDAPIWSACGPIYGNLRAIKESKQFLFLSGME